MLFATAILTLRVLEFYILLSTGIAKALYVFKCTRTSRLQTGTRTSTKLYGKMISAISCLAVITLAVNGSTVVVLSNTELPRDTDGKPLITGETSVVSRSDGTHYFYVNNWGGCADVDCCPSAGGCASCC